MLPMALISPTSFLIPAILTRTWEPLSIVKPSWSVNWGGVAFASYLHVLGINWNRVSQNLASPIEEDLPTGPHGTYKVRHEQLERASLAEKAVRIDGENHGINLELY